MPNIHSITDEDVADWKPIQTGMDLWLFSNGDEQYVSSDIEYVDDRIQHHLREIAKLEAVKVARMDPETHVLLEKVEELCAVMYGVDLDTYTRAYDDHTDHIFRAARHALKNQVPTPPSVSTSQGE